MLMVECSFPICDWILFMSILLDFKISWHNLGVSFHLTTYGWFVLFVFFALSVITFFL
jgi:hypothetical protein